MLRPVCVGQGRNPQRLFFSCRGSYIVVSTWVTLTLRFVKGMAQCDVSSKTTLMPRIYKNAADVDIAPASCKIIKNVKYRSWAPGQGVQLKGMSRTITMQGFTFAATLGVEKIKL